MQPVCQESKINRFVPKDEPVLDVHLGRDDLHGAPRLSGLSHGLPADGARRIGSTEKETAFSAPLLEIL